MEKFEDIIKDDLVAEITDLDPQRALQRPAPKRSRFRSPIFWRLLITASVLLLALVVVLESLPWLHEKALGLFTSHAVYVGSFADEVYALRSSDGSLLWRYATHGSTLLLPVVNSDVAYVGTNEGDVYALRINDGSVLWHYKTSGFIASLAVNDGVVYASCAVPDYFYALQAKSGTLLWRYKTNEPLAGTLVVVKGVIYGVAAPWPTVGVLPPSIIYAWHTRDGSLLWQHSIDFFFPQIVVADGNVYAGSAPNSSPGGLYVLRASDGALLWHYQTLYLTSPVLVAQGRVYFSSGDGTMYALLGSNGTPLWSYVPGFFRFMALEADSGAVYLVGLDADLNAGTMDALKASDGSLLWRYEPHAPIYSAIEINRVIYTISLNGALYALHAADGKLLWQRKLDAAILQDSLVDSTQSPLLVTDGVIFIRSQAASGNVYVLRASDGVLLWHYSPGMTSSSSR